MPMRNAVSTVPACGVNAIAHPVIRRVASSRNIVTHGVTALPRGGSTTMGRFL